VRVVAAPRTYSHQCRRSFLNLATVHILVLLSCRESKFMPIGNVGGQAMLMWRPMASDSMRRGAAKRDQFLPSGYPLKMSHDMKPKLTKPDDCPICKTELLQDGKPKWNWNISGMLHSSLRRFCSRCGYWEQGVWMHSGELASASPRAWLVWKVISAIAHSRAAVPSTEPPSPYRFQRPLTHVAAYPRGGFHLARIPCSESRFLPIGDLRGEGRAMPLVLSRGVPPLRR
jgi:hypothetical protein